jgi:excinuclease ABC subunit C
MPSAPGIYFFRDKSGRVLYLGKAANLKNRIKSYFSRQNDPRISKMLETAKSIDWQETDSEIEALILESQLIKKYRPPFNIMLRDDKQYFYVALTKEGFPKIRITHQPTKQQKITFSQIIGPFTDGVALKTALKLLRKIFPYCTCKQKHNNFCLNYHIGNCPGFCCLKKEVAAEERKLYRKNILAIKAVLSGQKGSLIKKLEKKMSAEVKNSNFEEAIRIRNQLERIRSFFENAKIIKEMELKNREGEKGMIELKQSLRLGVLPVRIEGYDISNIQGEFATGAMAVFTRSASSGQADFRPDKNEYRKFKIRTTGGDTGMLKEILTRRFNHPEWPYPDLILIDGGKGQLNAAIAAIPNKTPIIALTKNEKHIGDHILSTTIKAAIKIKKLPLAARNLILQIDAEAHRFAIRYYRKLHIVNLKTG